MEEQGFISAHSSKALSVVVEKAWRQEHEEAGHVASAVEAKKNGYWYSVLFLHPYGMALPKFTVGLLTPISSI